VGDFFTVSVRASRDEASDGHRRLGYGWTDLTGVMKYLTVMHMRSCDHVYKPEYKGRDENVIQDTIPALQAVAVNWSNKPAQFRGWILKHREMGCGFSESRTLLHIQTMGIKEQCPA
jgi:hypothetical protein